MGQLIALLADVWLELTLVLVIVGAIGGVLTNLFPPARRG